MNEGNREMDEVTEYVTVSKARRLIYVDASGVENNSVFKISLYDKENHSTHVLQLEDIEDNNEAEQYAIFYAVLYINKYNYKRCHILCDNQGAVNNKLVEFLSKDYNIGISWIPREANIVADKISKLEPTLKEKEWNLLKLFVGLIKKQCHNTKDNQEKFDKKVEAFEKEIEKLKNTIENQKNRIENQTKQINNLQSKEK